MNQPLTRDGAYQGRSQYDALDLREWIGPDGHTTPQAKLDLRKSTTRSSNPQQKKLFYEAIPMDMPGANYLDYNDQIKLPSLKWAQAKLYLQQLARWRPDFRMAQIDNRFLVRRTFWVTLIGSLSGILLLLAIGAVIMQPSLLGLGNGRGKTLWGTDVSQRSGGIGGGTLPSKKSAQAQGSKGSAAGSTGTNAASTSATPSSGTPVTSTVTTPTLPSPGTAPSPAITPPSNPTGSIPQPPAQIPQIPQSPLPNPLDAVHNTTGGLTQTVQDPPVPQL